MILRCDILLEDNETFEIVAYDPRGLDFPQDAAAVVATSTILDDDDGIPDQPSANPGEARLIFEPEPEPGAFPTVTAYDTSYIEGDSSFKRLNVLVTLDRPATASASIDWFTQQGSAANSEGDFDGASGTVNFVAGQRSASLQVLTREDLLPEPDESFEIVFNNPRSLNIVDGAQALSVEVTTVDNDSGRADLSSGIGAAGTPIFGPEQVDQLPTLRVQGTDIIEGDSSFQRVSLLVTLDGPTDTLVTLDYATQDITASAFNGDYDALARSVTIDAGQQSTRPEFILRGDELIEGDEAFQVLLTGISGGRFEGGAPALEATIGIIGDDGGAVSRVAGRTEPATGVEAPVSTAPIVPVIQIHDATMIEGSGSFGTMRFLVTLDRPAPSPVTFNYTTLDGSDSRSEDFDPIARAFTIPAGEQSGVISVTIRGDTLREDDESFDLFVYNAQNANFAGNTIGQVARGTILDNDSGAVRGEAGRGDPAPGVLRPEPDDTFVRVAPVAVSMREFDSGSQTYSVPILLSEPARPDVTLNLAHGVDRVGHRGRGLSGGLGRADDRRGVRCGADRAADLRRHRHRGRRDLRPGDQPGRGRGPARRGHHLANGIAHRGR
ncbi:Calx-beta domain-containing protein [Jannaschia seohaensis]|uniref:Calx-beta domain-containing protein n=1 Tax=Jannaschia seohaensis TaxID=475081 RepID=A0A2Y9B3Z2_9RHOB|nr:Calx-beta domain-containing protein [Jannaschia seohaensis]PWJ12117.1 Calx-beta domain-containing protein [Jannaschia seohaensis]SSA51220.1 Calx-beta domain-containing protein [Jannaschia seohaensis]